VVNGLSYTVGAGETVAVVGESGSGKSVSVLALVGLLPPRTATVTGRALLHGEDLLTMAPERLRQVRGPGVGMVFQDPMTSLNPVLTVGRQLTEGLRAHGSLSKATTALDVTVQAQILDLVERLRTEHGTGVVWITHDLGVVAGIADRVLVVYGGRCVEDGTVDDVLERPVHPYTRGLLGALPDLATGADQDLATIPGTPPPPTDLPAGCVFWPRCPVRGDARCETEQPPLAVVGTAGRTLPHRAATWCAEGEAS
jgi:peptide/nickel transport system ATP-binding protein